MKTHALKQSEVPLWLAGETELRVLVKPQPVASPSFDDLWHWDGFLYRTEQEIGVVLSSHCPYPVGSELALTEEWATDAMYDDLSPRDLPFDCSVQYKATIQTSWYGRWRPAITMPAECSRFHRRVVGVKVEHGEQWEWVLTLEVKHG
jgi:hypothetical protein